MFQVVEERPTRYRVGDHTSTNLNLVQYCAAEDAIRKVLDASFFGKAPFRCWTTLHNLCDPERGMTRDIQLILVTANEWLDNIEPQFAAIEGKVGYNVRPGVHRLIKTDDGREHGSREAAATHILLGRLKALPLANETVRAICNANKLFDDSGRGRHPGDESEFHFDTGMCSLFASDDDEYVFVRARVEKLRDALKAIIDVRNTKPRIVQ